jgi:hypothetical protein
VILLEIMSLRCDRNWDKIFLFRFAGGCQDSGEGVSGEAGKWWNEEMTPKWAIVAAAVANLSNDLVAPVREAGSRFRLQISSKVEHVPVYICINPP